MRHALTAQQSRPNTRISDLLISQRLLSQMQSDQQAIFRLQNQLTTGRRISLPSEDAPAALRAITEAAETGRPAVNVDAVASSA